MKRTAFLTALLFSCPMMVHSLSCSRPEPAEIPAGTPPSEAKQIGIAHTYAGVVSINRPALPVFGVFKKKTDVPFQHEAPIDFDALNSPPTGPIYTPANEIYYYGALTFSGVQFVNGKTEPLNLDYVSLRIRYFGGGGTFVPVLGEPILAELVFTDFNNPFTAEIDPPLCGGYPPLPQSELEPLKTCVASGRCPS